LGLLLTLFCNDPKDDIHARKRCRSWRTLSRKVRPETVIG